VGLNPGVVPDEQQAGALSALAEQDAAVDVSDENLGSLRQGVVAAAQTLLERADMASRSRRPMPTRSTRPSPTSASGTRARADPAGPRPEG